MSKSVNAHHILGSVAVVVVNGRTFTINDTHPSWTAVVKKLKAADYTDLDKILDVRKAVTVFSQGRVKITDDGELTFDGKPMHSVLAKRIVSGFKGGENISRLAKFMERVEQNPSQAARDELFLWLETSKLPFTEDGHFLAYKKVAENYKDIYSGKFDHSVGTTLSMPREKVDPDRRNTCSYGFHFCSLDYLNHYSSAPNDRVMIVKVDPANVVAIPADYSNQKGRATGYTVVAEFNGWVRNSGQDWDEELQEVPDSDDDERDFVIEVSAIDDEGFAHLVVIHVTGFDEEDVRDSLDDRFENRDTGTILDNDDIADFTIRSVKPL